MWLDAFEHCYPLSSFGFMFHSWPDGESYLEQENIVVTMFDFMLEEAKKATQNG